MVKCIEPVCNPDVWQVESLRVKRLPRPVKTRLSIQIASQAFDHTAGRCQALKSSSQLIMTHKFERRRNLGCRGPPTHWQEHQKCGGANEIGGAEIQRPGGRNELATQNKSSSNHMYTFASTRFLI